jgi:hypothetical protein
MQSLQLHLTGAARSWLNTLPNNSIGSWEELESQFAKKIRSTYKCPASLEEIKSCVCKGQLPLSVFLVINDNPYGLIFSLSFL